MYNSSEQIQSQGRARLSITFGEILATKNMNKIIIAQNESDATFGWNGVMQGFNVHYQHPETEMFIPGHSVYLSSRLTPIISVQNVQQTFLGDPVSYLFLFFYQKYCG